MVWKRQYAKIPLMLYYIRSLYYTMVLYYIPSHYAVHKTACFRLFCPTIRCSAAEDTAHGLSPWKSMGGTGVLVSEVTCSMS